MKLLARAPLAFLVLSCSVSITCVLLHASCTEHRLRRLSDLPLTVNDANVRQRTLLQFLAADGYAWMRQARDLAESGRWRLQFTHVDNAPDGREVAWSSGFAWWLVGLRNLHRSVTSSTDPRAWSWAAVWANPLLLVASLVILALLLARRFGCLTAGTLPFAMLGSPVVYEGFLPGYPDHHGLISLASLGTLLGLLMAGGGWHRRDGRDEPGWPRSRREIRSWMRFSAACGAVGLWVSAVSQIPLLFSIGLAAVGTARWVACDEGDLDCEAWAVWGRWGAGLTSGFYLIEHFPDRMGMQLVTNHPLHALAWLGGGEVLAVLTRGLARREPPALRERMRLALGAAAVLALPAAVLLGPSAWWCLGDPFLAAVHARIVEFLPLLGRVASGGFDLVQWAGPLPLVLVPTCVLLARRNTPAPARAALLLGLMPMLVFAALSLYQARWAALVVGPLLALLITTLGLVTCSASPAGAARWTVVLAVSALFTWTPASDLRSAWSQANESRLDLTPEEMRDLLLRDIAAVIAHHAGQSTPVVLASPSATVRLCYFADMRGIGTLYWENLNGLKTAAQIYGASSQEEAHEKIRAHGITHIVLVDLPGVSLAYIQRYYNLCYLGRLAPPLATTFAFRLLNEDRPPEWLRPIPYNHPLLQPLRAKVRIFEVVDAQEKSVKHDS